MSERRYDKRESAQRIHDSFLGKENDIEDGSLSGKQYSINQIASRIAQLLEGTLPGSQITLPQSLITAISDAGFSGGGVSDYVTVESESDFPTPSGGVITLEANTVYEIFGDVTITNSIDLNNSAIVGQSFRVNNLTYSPSSGDMFTGSEGGYLEQLTLSASGGGTSSMFNLTGSSSKALQVRQCNLVGSDLGTITGGYNIVQFFFCAFGTNTVGISITDGNIINFNSCAWFSNNTAPTFVDLNGDITTIQWLGGNSDTGNGGTLTALDISGVTSLERGTINGGATFLGSGTYVNGSFGTEWEVEARGLKTQKDETALGAIYVSSSTTTTISVVDIPVKVAGTTALEANSFRVSSPQNNRLQYDGTITRDFLVIASISVQASANNKDYTWYIYKNGSPVTGVSIQRKQGTGSDTGALALSGIVEMNTGDYLEVWVENNTDTTNVTAIAMNFAIK